MTGRSSALWRVLAGVAAGVVLGRLWRSATRSAAPVSTPAAPTGTGSARGADGAPDTGAAAAPEHDGWGRRMGAALEAAARGVRAAPPTPEAVEALLAAVPGGDGITATLLGGAVVDLTGAAPDGAARAAAHRLRALPSVRGVVDRVRRPSGPGSAGN